ncbi:Retrovirus-related Pol polyprotein from transposon TNT 1-94 [Hypsizygus marmoreus]|uniref:Retrovirus-related Pol polyprotein from transposon TNT 1-94 n=1 Tax=Hypsizygus marmoreus TaxID=39966 RepID=A0A369JLS8_HYPMA|nr:Retrovirus-related Pol polyprotein from transposon TNT 1-94 [Hypsizygus marmoreus]
MRIYAGLPPNLWDEFYLTSTHLHACTTTRSLSGKVTPLELWEEKRPDYSYMREIGCKAYVLIQNRHNPQTPTQSRGVLRNKIIPTISFSETHPKLPQLLTRPSDWHNLAHMLISIDRAAGNRKEHILETKSYRCYDRKSGNIYNSYHVRFLESHDGYPSPAPNLPRDVTEEQISTLESIKLNSSENPVILDDDEEFIPLPSDIQPEIPADAELPIIPPVPAPAPNVPPAPRRSTRNPMPTARVNPDNPPKTRTQITVEESRAAGERSKAARTECQKALEELRQAIERNDPRIIDGAAIEELNHTFEALNLDDADHDRVLAAISEAGGIDPSTLEFDDEPKTWAEAQASPDAKRWEEGYHEELKSLKDMGVYKLVPRSEVPQGTKVRKGRPVFRIKRDENGKAVRWKVRLVFKGFEQIYGKDYTKTTSPTARMESWRILLHIAATLGWDAQQIDIKTAFLYGLLPEEETQYMEQPPGFEEPGKEDWVWLIQCGLYGMKQSGRIWNKTMNENMLWWGFTRLSCESCIYYRKTDAGTVIAAVHVDDFLSIASTKAENDRFKDQMRKVWTISDLGTVRFVVGIAIEWDRPNHTVKLSQTALIDKIIQQFGQKDAAPLSAPMEPGLKLRRVDQKLMSREDQMALAKLPYRSLVRCLLYLAISTRPDIAHAVQQLSQFLDSYSYAHWNAAIWVVRYLKGTRVLKLHLGGTNPIELLGFTDSDWANCLDTRRSVGGYVWCLGRGALSWHVQKQKTVAASSCEAEYVAAFEATKECIWLRALLLAIGFGQPDSTTMLCDNNATIDLSEDPLLHARVKHIDIKFHFMRERVQSGEIQLRYINTKDNVADIFTKPLEPKTFTRLRGLLGLH